jgi:hypothetical protein
LPGGTRLESTGTGTRLRCRCVLPSDASLLTIVLLFFPRAFSAQRKASRFRTRSRPPAAGSPMPIGGRSSSPTDERREACPQDARRSCLREACTHAFSGPIAITGAVAHTARTRATTTTIGFTSRSLCALRDPFLVQYHAQKVRAPIQLEASLSANLCLRPPAPSPSDRSRLVLGL